MTPLAIFFPDLEGISYLVMTDLAQTKLPIAPAITRFAVAVLSSKFLRSFLWSWSLKLLRRQSESNPVELAFLLLTRLTRIDDPVFVYHAYAILGSLPERIFDNQQVQLAYSWLPIVFPDEKDRYPLLWKCQSIILHSFPLQKASRYHLLYFSGVPEFKEPELARPPSVTLADYRAIGRIAGKIAKLCLVLLLTYFLLFRGIKYAPFAFGVFFLLLVSIVVGAFATVLAWFRKF